MLPVATVIPTSASTPISLMHSLPSTRTQQLTTVIVPDWRVGKEREPRTYRTSQGIIGTKVLL